MKKRTATAEKSISVIISNSINKILVWVIAAITLISVLVLSIGQYSTCARDFKVATRLASDRVYWALQSYKNIVSCIGTVPALSDPNTPLEYKKEILDGFCEKYGLIRSKVINADGYSEMDDTPTYRGDRNYFKQAMKGNVYIQEPVVSRTDGQIAIIGAAPLYKNGSCEEEIVGVVFISIDPNLIHDIIEGTELSKNSFAHIIAQTGTVVASSDMSLVYDQNNNIQNAKFDRKYKAIAKVEQKMLDGETGAETVRMNGHLYFVSYAPIKDTPGWSICVGSAYVDYIDTLFLLVLLMVECLIISVFIVRIRSTKIANEVAEPVRRMSENIRKAAESGADIASLDTKDGNVSEEEPIVMKIISEAMGSIMDRLDLATTEAKEFLDSAVITDLVSSDMLRYIHGYYKAAFGVNVIVADSKGVVLVGRTNHGLVDANALRADESACFIMLNDRVIGSVIFKIPENCILDKSDAQHHAIYVSKILEIVALGNFRRSLQNRNNLKHAKDELEKINEYNIEIGEAARKMADEGEEIRNSGNAEDLREYAAKLISFCYDIVSRTDDFTNYNDRSGMSVRIREHVYKVDELVSDLKNDLERMHSALAEKISVNKSVDMPETLLGDAHRIRRMVENLVTAMTDEESDGAVEVYFESKKSSYATCLSVSIHGNKIQDENERERLKNLFEEEEEAGTVEGISASDLKLLSIARVVRRMNGHLRINEGSDGETWCTVVIPQLEVGADDK